MSRAKPTQVTVISSERVTPNMQRLTLAGEGLRAFPAGCGGDYIKLLFTHDGSTDIASLDEGQRPLMRTYSIRRFVPDEATIEVDFVRHQTDDPSCGFAARWAINARPGDRIHIAGPGQIKPVNANADWYFFVADMTALPALSAKVATLPEQAVGYAVIKVLAEQDIQPLSVPKGIQVTWLTGDESLCQRVEALPWREGEVAVWSASDFDSMRQLRRYFRNERGVDSEHIYLSSYWKPGVTEDGHKQLKQKDSQASPSKG